MYVAGELADKSIKEAMGKEKGVRILASVQKNFVP